MNLRALAEKDLAFTLEDSASGGACEVKFIDTDENEYIVNGRVGDIGFGYDADGTQISTRVTQVTWRLSSMMSNGKYLLPKRGWACEWQDLSEKTWTCYVTRCEPDRTIGIGRVWLSFDLSERENSEDGGD